ncbi:MAG: alpha/beta fold hydrolase [Lawsonella sp.]
MSGPIVGVCKTDDQPLCYFRWDAEEPRGVVQIEHGLGDHAQRYNYLAEKLAAAGYVVYAADHIGHGITGHMNGDFGKLPANAHEKILDGFEAMTRLVQKEYPGLPLIFIAHSWGSFLSQQYCLKTAAKIQGLVLTGTSFIPLEVPPDFFDFNRQWRDDPDCEPNEWLTRDPEVRKAAREDPNMVDILTNFMYEKPEEALKLVTPIPGPQEHPFSLLIQSGEYDPMSYGICAVEILAEGYKRITKLDDITLIKYPGARHEVYNEINKDEIIADLIEWLQERF